MCPPEHFRYQVHDTDNQITQLRKHARLTQEALAKATGISISTLRRWEQGQCEPTMQVCQMRAFCQAVHVPFDQLPPFLAH